MAMARRTKIIATIGPKSDSEPVLRDMVVAGMDVARLGMAHGGIDQALERMARIRAVAADVGQLVAVMADLPGPKVRIGQVPEDGLDLVNDARVQLVVGAEPSKPGQLSVDYASLISDVQVGDWLAIGDGSPRLYVEKITAQGITARVSGDATLKGRPGLHIPSERLRMATPTDEDLRLLDVLVDNDVDIVALSFVRSAHDVRRAGVEPHPRGPLVVAKIETMAAVANLPGIIEASGAIMVARGDLGIECGIEELPHLQKQIIRDCISLGRPVITATQMLESMIHSASPTRAEVTDVANAIFDGTSAVMLSAETAVGADPANAVATMARIASRADQEFDYDRWPRQMRNLGTRSEDTSLRITDAVSGATWRAATELGAAAVVCLSDSGFTVRSIARFRPKMPIVGLSTSERTNRQLALSWGVTPLLVPPAPDRNATVEHLAALVRDAGIVRSGDLVAVLWGSEAGGRKTDSLRLVRVP